MPGKLDFLTPSGTKITMDFDDEKARIYQEAGWAVVKAHQAETAKAKKK